MTTQDEQQQSENEIDPRFLELLINSALTEGVIEFRVIIADHAHEKYKTMCKAFGLKHPPHIMILHDVDESKQDIASYKQDIALPQDPIIVLSSEAYDRFLKGESIGEWIVGHELGHARSHEKKPYTRRRIVQGAASLAAGVVAAISARAAIDYIPPPAENTEGQEAGGNPQKTIFREGFEVAASGGVAYLVISRMPDLFMRLEELRAEGALVKVVPPRVVLQGIVNHLEDKFSRMSTLDAVRSAFEAQLAKKENALGRTFTDLEREVAWAKALAREDKPKRNLWEVLTDHLYPSFVTRVRRIESAMQEQAER